MQNPMASRGFQVDLNRAKPHFMLVPLMAQGHMIPMVDMARLLASAGATVTYITTPVNFARILPAIEHIQHSGLPIQFVELNFPTAEADLPSGCENIDLLPSPDLLKPFVDALRLLGPQFNHYLTTNLAALPDCIIFDSMNSWAATVAKSFGIPQVIFYGPSCFHILCNLLLKKSQVLKTITDNFELFAIPGLPEPVEVVKGQVNGWFERSGWEKISEEFYAALDSAQGVVMNTFDELELSFLEKFRTETGKKVWSIGPLCLSNKDVDSLAVRGKISSIDTQELVNWLDSKAPSSVIFVSFGTLACNSVSQLLEIGRGLESALSTSPSLSFIWVVKEEERSQEVEKNLTKLEERIKLRGMVIRGWAPQPLILTHVAVGGFMTHCGWNSTLEAVTAGVVMATWPRFGDQFLNEKLIVEMLKVGVTVGAKMPTWFVDGKSNEELVKGDEVSKVVERVMDGGKEGEERRKRAREFGEKARKAMEEGGSSFENLKTMIQFAKPENKHME